MHRLRDWNRGLTNITSLLTWQHVELSMTYMLTSGQLVYVFMNGILTQYVMLFMIRPVFAQNRPINIGK